MSYKCLENLYFRVSLMLEQAQKLVCESMEVMDNFGEIGGLEKMKFRENRD